VPSEGSASIIREALKDDPRPLHIAFLGPLTDMASALLEEPAIAERNVRVVWIGGEDWDWPMGGWEFNLRNDVNAANVVFRSKVELWQIPSTIYKRMAVSYAELVEKVYDKGELGRYLVEQMVDWNKQYHPGPIEYRSLGDSPAIGVMMYPECGWFEWCPAPEFNPEMNYVHTGRNRPIRVYRAVDQRFILDDFFAKLTRVVPPGAVRLLRPPATALRMTTALSSPLAPRRPHAESPRNKSRCR
jgi:purine nucleosidase